MYGEFEGGIKLTGEEKKTKLKFMKKTCWGAVTRYNELRNITNYDLADRAIKCYNISECFIVGTTFKHTMMYNHISLTSWLGQLLNIL